MHTRQLTARVPYSTCWYGLFFELEAQDSDVEVLALYTQTVRCTTHPQNSIHMHARLDRFTARVSQTYTETDGRGRTHVCWHGQASHVLLAATHVH
jgi:hypothetical protein